MKKFVVTKSRSQVRRENSLRRDVLLNTSQRLKHRTENLSPASYESYSPASSRSHITPDGSSGTDLSSNYYTHSTHHPTMSTFTGGPASPKPQIHPRRAISPRLCRVKNTSPNVRRRLMDGTSKIKQHKSKQAQVEICELSSIAMSTLCTDDSVMDKTTPLTSTMIATAGSYNTNTSTYYYTSESHSSMDVQMGTMSRHENTRIATVSRLSQASLLYHKQALGKRPECIGKEMSPIRMLEREAIRPVDVVQLDTSTHMHAGDDIYNHMKPVVVNMSHTVHSNKHNIQPDTTMYRNYIKKQQPKAASSLASIQRCSSGSSYSQVDANRTLSSDTSTFMDLPLCKQGVVIEKKTRRKSLSQKLLRLGRQIQGGRSKTDKMCTLAIL